MVSTTVQWAAGGNGHLHVIIPTCLTGKKWDRSWNVPNVSATFSPRGYHRADVAILYPVESVVAGYDQTAVQKAFSLGEYLYREGVDFDFMDYESLAKANIKNRKIHISGEEFKVLIIRP